MICLFTFFSCICLTVPKKEEIVEVIIFVPAAILGSIPSSIIIGKRIVPKASPTNPPSIPTKKEESPIVIIMLIDKSVENKLSTSYSFVYINDILSGQL